MNDNDCQRVDHKNQQEPDLKAENPSKLE